MILEKFKIPNFIIGGTYKAGTTSVFSYLRDHPEVCACRLKEPHIFSGNYDSIIKFGHSKIDDLFNYTSQTKKQKIYMEATVGYLEHGCTVAERIHLHLDNPKILFILRDPIDRLLSYYNFYVSSQLEIPANISFDQFIKYCEDYLNDSDLNRQMPFKKRHLRALPAGRYCIYIKEYLKYFNSQQIKILFYEHLKMNAKAFMEELCDYLDINKNYYNAYDFQYENVTFSSRNKAFHNFIWYLWRKFLWKYINHHPKYKNFLLSSYKLINTKRNNKKTMDLSLRLSLIDFYSESKKDLQDLIGSSTIIPWHW